MSKRYNHINNKKRQAFYCSLGTKYSDRLFEVKFKKSFSFYLFLYLKDEYESTHGITKFSISSPIDVNFSLISEYAEVGRNTVKRAYKELVDFEMVIPFTWIGCKNPNQINKCMVINDLFIQSYDKKTSKVIFNL
ncbi:MAG: hypothetical protein KDC73_09610 [Ignavibacteriae bacterium]|nr:hypothetical protein [Ignavibacteriota bacterium]